jgi:hypothetical protein
MKKTFALTLVLLMAFSTATFVQLNFPVEANGMIPTPNTQIVLIEPKDAVYANSPVTLKFNVTEAFRSSTFNYSIDYSDVMFKVENLTVTKEIDLAPGYSQGLWMYQGADFVGCAVLPNLSDGKHHMTIYQIGGYNPNASNPYEWSKGVIRSEVVFFTVDTTPPTVSVAAPVNATYGPSVVPLNFTVNEPASWMGYSLDGQENNTVTGNMTLPELLVGRHMLTVYANDTAGNMGVLDNVTFTVANASLVSFKPSSTTSVIGVVLGITVVIALLILAICLKRTCTKKITDANCKPKNQNVKPNKTATTCAKPKTTSQPT